MDFLNKLGKKFSETYNIASEKTTKLAKETKLKIKIADTRENMKMEYMKIGEAIYKKYLNNRDDNIALQFITEFKAIDKAMESIKNAESEILYLKNRKKCSKCGEEFEEEFEFCPNCGSKNQVDDIKVFDAEIVNPEESNKD